VSASGVVLRRDVLLVAGLFKERCRKGEDKEMWIRLLAISDTLSSARVCSSYYRAVPGAGNDTTRTNIRHCLCDTLDDMIAWSSGNQRHLLVRLFNQTVVECMRSTVDRERLSPEVYRGFFVSISRQAYLSLLLLKHIPVPLLRIVRRGRSLASNLSRPVR
jgi:succinoglycan biosynthesis protein ExoO